MIIGQKIVSPQNGKQPKKEQSQPAKKKILNLEITNTRPNANKK